MKIEKRIRNEGVHKEQAATTEIIVYNAMRWGVEIESRDGQLFLSGPSDELVIWGPKIHKNKRAVTKLLSDAATWIELKYKLAAYRMTAERRRHTKWLII